MQVQSVSRPASPGGLLRVLVADDHRVTLWGLQRMIESAQPRMALVGCATSREELLNHEALGEADVLLLDLDLAGHSSIDALPDLRRRTHAHVLVLTGSDDPALHRDAVLRGARGVLHKSTSADMVLRAIDRVGAGEVWLRQDLLSQVLGSLTGGVVRSEPKSPDAQRIDSLTQRERDVIAAVVRHTGAKQLVIADALEMSEHTLRNHLTTIYSKLGVRGRLELHLFATEHGLAACAS